MDLAELRSRLGSNDEIAVIDTRDHTTYAAGHLIAASHVPLDELAETIGPLVPRNDTPIVVSDGSSQPLSVLTSLGYTDLHVLAGGLDAWVHAGGELFSGQYVASKALGELVETGCDTPSLDVAEVNRRRAEGDDLVILDSRPIEEYRARTIPGAVCVPGAELVHRVRDLAPHPDTTVLVSCGGRTRSIIGAQSLINAGLPNPVAAVENGTMGWTLAGLDVETDADRIGPEPSEDARMWSAEAAARVRERYRLEITDETVLADWVADPSRTTFVFDVRTPEEYSAGHLPGARWAPGGQLVQATDTWMATRNARVVLTDDDGVRATMTAHWLDQLGWTDTVVLPTDPKSRTATGADPTAPSPSRAPLAGTSTSDDPLQRFRDYLSWELGLVDQVARDGTSAFNVR